jgi:hypothetical protein
MGIRTLKPSDWKQLSKICSEYTNWTPPSRYIIWVLNAYMPAFSLVAENKQRNLIGYMLIIPLFSKNEIFVWQLGIKPAPKIKMLYVALAMIREVKKLCIKHKINKLHFSAEPTRLKFINLAAKRIFGSAPASSGYAIPATCRSSPLETPFTLNTRKKDKP